MKRIAYVILATISGVVLLFSYRTSVEAVAPQAESATAGTDASSSSSGSDPSASESATGSETSESSQSSDSESSDSESADSESQSSDSESESSGSGTTGTTGSTGSSGSAGTSGTSSAGLADGTYTGSSVNTRFGPVQVQISVSGGQITAAQAVDYPSENPRDQQINQFAIPRLVSETLSAQSANIDMISGATYTSDGYIQSLQSAIDQATS